MATLANIESPIWGMSIYGYGVIVEGIAAIRQRMDLSIRTTKGTDPLRPEFGSYVYKYVDAPLNIAIPNIKRELLECLDIWVKDIRVVSIRHTIPEPGNPVFEILYRVLDESVIDRLLFDLRAGQSVTDVISEIILQAAFPDNPDNYRYQFVLQKNGSQVFPLPNPDGYATIQEMYDWIISNMAYLGRWYLLPDRIALYMSSEGVTSASFEIKVLPIVRISADFPALVPGQFFTIDFIVNGAPAVPAMPAIFGNIGDVLAWVQSNWSSYATWQIEYLLGEDNSVFDDEFSDEFDIRATGYRLIGISNNPDFEGTISISTE